VCVSSLVSSLVCVYITMLGFHYQHGLDGARRKYKYGGQSRKRMCAAARVRALAASASASASASSTEPEEVVDVVVIGSGIGGLSCGSVLAKHGYETLVLESHYVPGGCCHTFPHKAPGGDGEYVFEVGPSILEGPKDGSTNPLQLVLEVLGEEVENRTYNGWTMHDGLGPGAASHDEPSSSLPTPMAIGENSWRYSVGPDREPGGFEQALREHAENPELAVAEWRRLRERMRLLSEANDACPLLNLRQDFGLLLTTLPALPFYLSHPGVLPDVPLLFDSFHRISEPIITEPFLKRFIDALCFFSGYPAEGTMGAAMVYCLSEFHKEGASLMAPIGGSGAVIDALIRGLEKYGGRIEMKRHVEEILVEPDPSTGAPRAVGVRLKNGKVVKARKAVVSNATAWDTAKMLHEDAMPDEDSRTWLSELGETPAQGSIAHLFLGLKGEGMDWSKVDAQHLIIEDWGRPLSDPQNVVTMFFPSLLDPTCAPPGKHVAHVYTAGSEPYHEYEGLDRRSEEYKQKKEERLEILWRSIERVIPDVRERAEVVSTATPLTHERFLRRRYGTYGPAFRAGAQRVNIAGLNVSAIPFPGVLTPVDGLLRCGDGVFPGIGVPAAAASGVIAANTLAPIEKHLGLLLDLQVNRWQNKQQKADTAAVQMH